MFTQLSVQMPDQPGTLAKFAKTLNDNNIAIRSITVSQIPGVVLFIVDKTEECMALLTSINYEFTAKIVIAVLLPDNPSSSEEIQKLAEILGENGVNIDFLYNTFIRKTNIIILHVSDNDKATEILKAKGMYLLEKLVD